jgi:hypothetical protein
VQLQLLDCHCQVLPQESRGHWRSVGTAESWIWPRKSPTIPDLRDRGFIYLAFASARILRLPRWWSVGDKPVIEDDTFRWEPALLTIPDWSDRHSLFVPAMDLQKRLLFGALRGTRWPGLREKRRKRKMKRIHEDEKRCWVEAAICSSMGGLSVQESYTKPRVELVQVCSADKSGGSGHLRWILPERWHCLYGFRVLRRMLRCTTPLSTYGYSAQQEMPFGLSR